MRRDEILRKLRKHRRELRAFGVKSIGIFGSVARGEERPDSDVDVLVEFEKPVGLFEFVRLKLYLEELLGQQVDLVTPDAIRDFMRDDILGEVVHAT